MRALLGVVLSAAVSIGLGAIPDRAHATVVFQDDFESGNLSKTQGSARWTNSARTRVNCGFARDGACSLEFDFEGSISGDAMAEQRFTLAPAGVGYAELWIRYDLFVPENYYHRNIAPSNNKGFIYLWSGDSSAPDQGYGNPRPLLSDNWWAASNGQSEASLHVRRPGSDQHLYEFTELAVTAADRGKWMRVLLHFKLASAANNDGVAQYWKTPESGARIQILNKTNGAWYESGSPGFNNGYLLGYANAGFTQNTKLYIDNIVFSTTPIGPYPPASVTVDR